MSDNICMNVLKWIGRMTMTFRQKLLKDKPKSVGDSWEGGCELCPYHHGYEEEIYCKEHRGISCEDCWNRECRDE